MRTGILLALALGLWPSLRLAAAERTVWASSITIEQDIPRVKAEGKVFKLVAAPNAPEEVKKTLADAKSLLAKEKDKNSKKYLIVRGKMENDTITVNALVIKEGEAPKNSWPEEADMTPEEKKQYEAFKAENKKKKKADKTKDNEDKKK